MTDRVKSSEGREMTTGFSDAGILVTTAGAVPVEGSG